MSPATELIVAVAAVAGAILVLANFVKKLWAGIRATVHRLEALENVTAKELTHNGGSSLKDHAKEARTGIAEVQQRLEDFIVRVDRRNQRADVFHEQAERELCELNERLGRLEKGVEG